MEENLVIEEMKESVRQIGAAMACFQELHRQAAVLTAYQIAAPIMQMEAAIWGATELRKQMEATIAPLKAFHWMVFSTEKWREQIEAITAPARATLEWAETIKAPLRQLKSDILTAQAQSVFALMWYNQIRALFAIFPRAIKRRKTRRGDLIYYPCASQIPGLHLTIHQPKPEKGWFWWHAHIKDGRGKVHKDVNPSWAIIISGLSPFSDDLNKIFKHFEEQACN